MLNDQEFLTELRQEFVGTVDDEFSFCQELLMSFEQEGDVSALDGVLRRVHSLKGSAHSVEWKDVADLIHVFESKVLDAKKCEKDEIQKRVSQLLDQLDSISQFLHQKEAS